MKKKLWILFFLISCSMAFAFIDAKHECDKKSCVEGSMAHWSVAVSNNINKTIVVEYIRLVDENDLSIAYHDAERNKTFVPGESYIYTFDTLIVAPPSGYTWYYKPCMRVRLEGSNTSQFVCKDGVKSFSVLPKDKTECSSDEDCAINEICEQYTLKCKSIECKEGEAVNDHQCVQNGIESTGSKTKIVIIVLIAFIILIAIAAIILSKSENENEEDNWYEEKTAEEKKTAKNKRNKKKAKKQKK
jgi:hypothetical protein